MWEIDRIVEVRERQIKLLGELRTSVISRAVTRGLNPNAPLKDSGIDWIGQIPEHWEVRKISRIFSKIGSGTTPKSGNEDYYAENGENWLQTGDLNDSYINDTSKKITIKALEDHSLRFYPEGSIVMAMYGATIGKLGLLNIKTTTNQACCVMAGNKVYHSKYGFNTLLAARTHILTLAYGGGQPNISQDKIREQAYICPSLEEQQQIADFLDSKTASIDSAIQAQKAIIEKLKEYKQAVITNSIEKYVDKDTKMSRLKFFTYMKGRIGWQGLGSDDFISEGPYCITSTDFENDKAAIAEFDAKKLKSVCLLVGGQITLPEEFNIYKDRVERFKLIIWKNASCVNCQSRHQSYASGRYRFSMPANLKINGWRLHWCMFRRLRLGIRNCRG